VAEAAKVIEVMRQQLYNVINGRSAVTPEMAMRFEEASGGGCRRVAEDASRPRPREKCARAKGRSSCAVSRGRFDGSHVRPAVVEGIADRTTLGARTLIAAREAFTDTNNDMVAVTGTAT
jgi:hypothetical protein